MAAGGIEDAHTGRGEAHPIAGRGLKGLDEDLADVMADPFIKNSDEEVPELPGLHRTFRNGMPLLQNGHLTLVQALDGGDKLYPGGTNFIPQKPVDLQGVIGINAVDGG
jgi:hypothetical protein